MRARVKPTESWVSKSKAEFENEDEVLACRRIILKIVRYMKDNKMSQKDLAEKLNVSPQYVNKLLHGQDLDLKVTTVMRYGRILGLRLIVLPEEEPVSTHVDIFFAAYTPYTPYAGGGIRQFKYNEFKALPGFRLNN